MRTSFHAWIAVWEPAAIHAWKLVIKDKKCWEILKEGTRDPQKVGSFV